MLTEEEKKKRDEVIERIAGLGLLLPVMTTPPYELVYGKEEAEKRFDKAVEKLEGLTKEYKELRAKELREVL
jgi:predicted ATPase